MDDIIITISGTTDTPLLLTIKQGANTVREQVPDLMAAVEAIGLELVGEVSDEEPPDQVFLDAAIILKAIEVQADLISDLSFDREDAFAILT